MSINAITEIAKEMSKHNIDKRILPGFLERHLICVLEFIWK